MMWDVGFGVWPGQLRSDKARLACLQATTSVARTITYS